MCAVQKSACQKRPNSLEEQLETYKTKGSYSCMTHDTVRNVRFETSLKVSCAFGHGKNQSCGGWWPNLSLIDGHSGLVGL